MCSSAADVLHNVRGSHLKAFLIMSSGAVGRLHIRAINLTSRLSATGIRNQPANAHERLKNLDAHFSLYTPPYSNGC